MVLKYICLKFLGFFYRYTNNGVFQLNFTSSFSRVSAHYTFIVLTINSGITFNFRCVFYFPDFYQFFFHILPNFLSFPFFIYSFEHTWRTTCGFCLSKVESSHLTLFFLEPFIFLQISFFFIVEENSIMLHTTFSLSIYWWTSKHPSSEYVNNIWIKIT